MNLRCTHVSVELRHFQKKHAVSHFRQHEELEALKDDTTSLVKITMILKKYIKIIFGELPS